jgi:hypothetical protein
MNKTKRGRYKVKLLGKAVAIILLTLIAGASAFGDLSDSHSHKHGDQQWKLSFGIGNNHKIPRHTLVPHLDFNVATLEFEQFTAPRTSIGCELSLASKTNGDDNEAVSASGNYTRYFLAQGRVTADYKFGVGVMHLQDKVRGQATRNNFNEHLGLRLQYATSTNSAISLEYTFYHASNAGIKCPNHGINATVFAIGYSWYR